MADISAPMSDPQGVHNVHTDQMDCRRAAYRVGVARCTIHGRIFQAVQKTRHDDTKKIGLIRGEPRIKPILFLKKQGVV